MMNRKEFYEYVKDNVKEYLPESYKDAEIKLQEVEKNNGLKLTGITIPNGDQRIVPTVYLDSLYQEYIHGKDVDSCVGDVADMRIEAQGKAEFFDMGVPDILDYEKMKDYGCHTTTVASSSDLATVGYRRMEYRSSGR